MADQVVGNEQEGQVQAKLDGAFVKSLKRNNTKIKADRAEAIGEDAELRYKRYVEDLRVDIKRMRREQDNMLDLSPENSFSLMVANNFDSKAFVEKDNELGVKIRESEIKLEIAEKRFGDLFGGI